MRNKIILIVDDDPLSVKILHKILSSAGYQVIRACDGYEAFYKIKLLRPALIITDILMPSLSGYQLVIKVRELECALRMIPIVVISAKSSMENLFSGLKIEAFLKKPLDPKQLIEITQTIVGPPQTEESEKIQIEHPEIFQGDGLNAVTAHYFASTRHVPLSAGLHTGSLKVPLPNRIEIYGKNLETLEKLKKNLEDGYYEVHIEHSVSELLKTTESFVPGMVLIEYLPGHHESISAYRKLKSHPATMQVVFLAYCEEGVPYWQQSIIPDSEILTFPREHPETLIPKIKDQLAA